MRARNMAAMARETGLTRETLYRAFTEVGNPTLATLSAVIHALGFKLSIKPDVAADGARGLNAARNHTV
jgi:probable addiction module antidote protein